MAADDFASPDANSETEMLGQLLHPAVTPFAREAPELHQLFTAGKKSART